MKKIVLLDQAISDLAAAIHWYSPNIDLTQAFYSEFLETVNLIEKFPELFAPYGNGYRRALLKHYPYSIIYEVRESHVEIHAIFHLQRKDDHWFT